MTREERSEKQEAIRNNVIVHRKGAKLAKGKLRRGDPPDRPY